MREAGPAALDLAPVNRARTRILLWVLRALWVVGGVSGWSVVAAAVDGRSGPVRAVASIVAAAVWAGGVAGLAIPAVATLVILRVAAPMAPIGLAIAWVAGAEPAAVGVALTATLLVAVVALGAPIGSLYVQASAYGHEQRFALRPPPAFLLAAVLAWALAAAGLLLGPVALAGRNWPAGVPLSLLIGVGVFAWPRWLRLAQRWLVVVPAALVVHDPLVLAETLMVRRADVAGVQLAPAGSEAADLTGPAAGHALEIATRSSVTAIYAGTPANPRGTAVHLTAMLIAPSRPGQALAAALAR